MDKINLWYQQTTWIAPLLGLLSLLGFVLSIYFYQKSKKTKKPIWGITSNNYINENHTTKIKVYYDDKEVNQLTESKMYYWNKGREQINHIDYSSTEPFGLKIRDTYEILDAVVIRQTQKAVSSKLVISDNKKELHIITDYLGKNDGCLIQIHHTGKSGSDLERIGIIKGVNSKQIRKVIVNFALNPILSLNRSKKHWKAKYYASLILMIVFPLLPILGELSSKHRIDVSTVVMSLIIGLFYWCFAYIAIRNKPPKELIDNTN